MTRKLGWLIALSCACGVGDIGDNQPESRRVVAEWNLVADQALALRDLSRGGLGYPNPFECAELAVRLDDGGNLCGRCASDAGVSESCGGPAAGIPYFVLADVSRNRLDLRVLDLFGNEITRAQGLNNTCASVPGSGSTPCTVCTDESGVINGGSCSIVGDQEPTDSPPDVVGPLESNACARLGLEAFLGTINGFLDNNGLPPFTPDVDALLENPPLDPDSDVFDDLPLGSEGALCAEYSDEELEQEDGDYIKGSGGRLRCGHIARDALSVSCELEVLGCDGELRADFERGLHTGYASWTGGITGDWGWEEQHGIDDDDDDDDGFDPSSFFPFTGDSEPPPSHGLPPVTGEESADSTPPEGEPDPENPEGEMPSETEPEGEPERELPECSGSPLVMPPLDGAMALTSSSDGVVFDLWGTGIPVRTGWVERGSLLALDGNFNGQVDHGRELFGEASPLVTGGFAANGFEALAQYDQLALGGNQDGRIDADDAVFVLLQVWSDRNLNGVSEPSELVYADEAGILALDVSFVQVSEDELPFSVKDNEVYLAGTVHRTGGSSTPVYDVWFAYDVLVTSN